MTSLCSVQVSASIYSGKYLKVGLTNFNGFSENSIQQEFWISVLLANLAMLIKTETDGIIDETVNTGQNRHRYQTNMNELIGCISMFIHAFILKSFLNNFFEGGNNI